MVTKQFRLVAVLAACFAAGYAHAASLYAGNAFYSIAPYTQMGTSVNLMTINQLTFGYMVAGQFQVNVPAGAVSGTLMKFQVKRLLNPNYGTYFGMYLQHYIVGFSQPSSGGTFGTSSGKCKTYLDFTGMPANTPLSLTNGAATWNVNQTGQSFNYNSGNDVYLVQDFEIDGVKTGGPAGTWIVDLPVTAEMVPEPAPMIALVLGLTALWMRRRS